METRSIVVYVYTGDDDDYHHCEGPGRKVRGGVVGNPRQQEEHGSIVSGCVGSVGNALHTFDLDSSVERDWSEHCLVGHVTLFLERVARTRLSDYRWMRVTWA